VSNGGEGVCNSTSCNYSQCEGSVRLKTLAYLKRNMCNALRSKYGLCSYDGIDAIKHAVFKNFSAALAMVFCF